MNSEGNIQVQKEKQNFVVTCPRPLRDSELNVCAGGEMPKIALGNTGLHKILGRDYGIEEPAVGDPRRSRARNKRNVRKSVARAKLFFCVL